MLDFVTAIAVATKKADDTSDTVDEPTLLIRTRQMKLTAEQATTLFPDDGVLCGVCLRERRMKYYCQYLLFCASDRCRKQ